MKREQKYCAHVHRDSQVTADRVDVNKQNYIDSVVRKLLSDWRCTLLTAATPNTKFVSFTCTESRLPVTQTTDLSLFV